MSSLYVLYYIKIRDTMLYYFNEDSKCRLCTYYVILKYALQCFIILIKTVKVVFVRIILYNRICYMGVLHNTNLIYFQARKCGLLIQETSMEGYT